MNTITCIKDLVHCVNQKVNLLGVILEFSVPRKSQGTDYVTSLKIVDKSQQNPELSINIFSETIDSLPHVRSHGDIIILKSVRIKKFQNEISAIFYKDSSSFALFDGKLSRDVGFYQASPKFSLTEYDIAFVTRERHWSHDVKFSSGKRDYLLSMQDISDKAHFDLVCQVLHVCYEETKGEWMLFLWDGTDAPPLSLDGKLNDEEQNPLPLHIEPFPLDIEVLRNFHSVGTVLRVTADRSYENFGLHFTYSRKWVRIRNMSKQIFSGMWHGILSPSSKIRLLSDNDDIVLEYLRKVELRYKGRHGLVPLRSNPSELLTVFDGKNAPFTTLMDVITHEEVNVRFRCIVRVVSIYPSAKAFCTLDGSNDHKMRLTLEDPTARIRASLSAKEWLKFLGGRHSVDVLTNKIKMLLGVPGDQNLDDDSEFSRSPPWIQCGIAVKKSGDSEHRLYFISGTTFVG